MSLSSPRRRLYLVGGAILVGVLAILILTSSPFFHHQLLGRGFAALEQQYGIIGHADDLEVSVARLDVRLRGLTLATREHPDEPFFTVDEARIDFPWSAVWSEISIQALALVSPKVSVHTDANGLSNLPAARAAAANPISPSPRLPIGHLTIEDLSVAWHDEALGLSLDGGQGTLTLSGTPSRIEGPLTLTEDIEIEVGGSATRISELQGQLSFDGSTLGLDRLTVETAEGQLTTTGTVSDVLSSPTLDLSVNAILSLPPLATRLDQTAVTGELTIVGTVVGQARDVAAALSLSTDRVSWNQLDVEALNGQLRVTPTAAHLDELSMTLGEGTVSASGLVSFSENASSSLDVEWDAVTSDVLFDTLGRDWSAVPHPALSGTRLRGSAGLRWTDLDPRSSTLDFRNLSSGHGRAGEIRLDGQDGKYRLTIDESIDGARLVGIIDGSAESASWPEISIAGELELGCGNVSLCHTAFFPPPAEGWLADALADLGGHLLAQLEVAGSLESPRVGGPVTGRVTGVGGLAPIDLSLGLSGDVARLELSSVELRLGENTVRGDTQIAWEGTTLSGGLTGELTDLGDFGALAPDGWMVPSGAVQFETDLQGTLASPRVDLIALEGTAALTPLFEGTPDEIPIQANLDISASGRLLPDMALRSTVLTKHLRWNEAGLGSATARVDFGDGLTNLSLELDELGITGAVRFSADGERSFSGSLAVSPRGNNLSRLGATANLPLAGDLSVDAAFSGSLDSPDSLTARAELGLADGGYGDQVITLSPPRTTIEYGPEFLRVDDTVLQVGSSTVGISGGLTPFGGDTLSVAASGAAEDLLGLFKAVPGSEAWLPEIDVRGGVALETTVTGWVNTPVVEGTFGVEQGWIREANLPALEEIDLRMSYAGGLATIDALSARWQGASITGTGSIPVRLWSESLPRSFVNNLPNDQGARLRIDVESLVSDALTGYLDDRTVAQIDGLVTGSFELETEALAFESARGTLTLEEGAVTISGIPVRQRRPTRLELEDGQVSVAVFDWGNEEDYLSVGGSVELGEDPTIDLTVSGSIDLVALTAFTSGPAVAGQADLNATLQGPRSDLDITGTIELADASLRVARPRFVLSGLNGALMLRRDTVTPFELKGDLNGGPVEIGGVLQRIGIRPQGTLTLSGRQVAMNVPDGLRTEVDADIAIIFEPDETVVSGTTTIQRGDYREPMSLTGGLLSTVDRRQQVRIVRLDAPRPIDALRLDVQVVTAEDIVIENNYVDALLGGDIRLGGTVGAPAVTGRVALLEGGRIRVGTRTYDIEAGSIDLVDPTSIDPRVNIRARTRASGYDITLSVSGGQDDLTTSFQSDPPLPENDIVSVLLTGRTLSEAADESGVGAREQALGLVSNELLGAVGRDIGLDVRIGDDTADTGQVRFDSSLIAGEGDPSTRLTVGRRLNDRVQLILSQDLRDSGISWIVSYLARDNLELRTLFNDGNDRAYELRHALDFGAPPRLEHFVRPDRTPEEVRIATIAFTGSTGFSAEQLRDTTRLRAGDLFDFHRWQEDQDRLQRFYSDHGYREVRITSRRSAGPTPSGVRLVYEITRGPRTRLTVTGYDLPGSVLTRLHDAWEHSVFDGFLLDELESIGRVHLRDEGYLQATIEATVARTDNAEKVIVLRISPGFRTETRKVQLIGNSAIDDATLTALATSVFEAGGEWGDTEVLEDAITRLYRSIGMLEATATAGGVEFDGGRASLPVRISEGRTFVIARVELDGLDARPEDDLRDVLAVTVGMAYSDVTVQEALTRLELDYRQQGFNLARVSAESTVDIGRAEVVLIFTIREGRQEILDSIVVEGATRTHPQLVSTALDLEVDRPVNVTAWNLARKRLYDTGVFRTVDLRAEDTNPLEPRSGVRSVRARVLLEEWPTYGVTYGIRVNDFDVPENAEQSRDFGLAFAGDVSRRNLLGRGATVGASVRAGERGQAVRAYFRIPRSFGLPLRSSIYAEQSREKQGEENGGFTQDLRTLTFEQRVRLPLDTRLTYSANFDRNHSFDERPSNPDSPFDIRVNIVRFAGNAVLDRRDNLFNATRGWFHSSHIEYGYEPGEGEINYAKYLAQQYHHWRVGPHVVVASGARVGLATGLGDPLIPSERFFAGGGNTVRGYAQDSLGPTSSGQAVGGNALLIFNQEVRFPIIWRLGGVGFIDAGNVFEASRDISIFDLAVGTGLGLRVDTPVGLLRFDYGFPLSRQEGDPIGRFVFSIGQAF